MNFINKYAGVLATVAIVIAIGGYFYPQVQGAFGNIGSATNFYSLKTDAGITTSGASTFGGTVTVTTSNTATSTLSIGCVQMTATSTATPIHLEYNTQSTTTLNGASAGSVAWKYGSCPV